MSESVEKEVVTGEEQVAQEGPQVIAELSIRVFDNGNSEVNVPEGSRELKPFEVEMITRNVYEQLRDGRIASQAVEMFKSKLG